MDKRKLKGAAANIDELALVKSAAWAWYQRGSDGRTIREIDGWRSTKIEPKSSRFKLEALRKVQLEASTLKSSPRSNRSTASNCSLLDNYEIERISKQLDYYIESSHAKYHGGNYGVPVVAEVNNKVVRSKKIAKGFWLRHVPACGSSRNDVVENKSFEYPRPEKRRVAVAEVVSSRPRPWGIRA